MAGMDSHAYTPRKPKATAFYQLVENHYEDLERQWDERFSRNYGSWRGHIMKAIFSFLDCGDLKNGFARIRCKDCGHEFLLAFSCKKRHFCPSCHERRVVEFGEFCVSNVLAEVPHRQWVFSIPKILRPWFLRDRRLLGEMCAIVWKLLSKFIKTSTDGAQASGAKAAAIMAIQTFGEQLAFNPHIHVICADGTFDDDGTFREAWAYDIKALEDAFADAIFKLLQERGLHDSRVEMMRSWAHSGFNVYRGSQVLSDDREGLERLCRYIARCPFALSRLTYDRASATVSYLGKTTGATKLYPALDFLARLVVQIPNPFEQQVRYCGFYSNKCRGMRRKAGLPEDTAPEVVPPKKLSSISWARLIAKVFLVDPLICPKCEGQMKIVSFIEQDDLIAKILKHLGLWESPDMRPVANSPPPLKLVEYVEEDFSQLLPPEYAFEAS